MNNRWRYTRMAIAILIYLILSGCLPRPSQPPAIAPTDAVTPPTGLTPSTQSLPTITAQSHPPVTPTFISERTPTVEPTPMAPPAPPQVRFVAATMEKLVCPQNRAVHCWGEDHIEVYQPPQTEPVFRLFEEGVSYDHPAFSPDGRWLAYVEDRKEPVAGYGQARLRIVRTDWQDDHPITAWLDTHVLAWVEDLLWSADSHWLAFRLHNRQTTGDALYVANVDTGEMRLVDDPVYDFVWSPQEPTRLAFLVFRQDTGEEMCVVNIDDLAHPQRVVLPKVYTPWRLAWRPDAAQLAICAFADDSASSLWVVDAESLTTEQVAPRASQCGEMRWSADGLWLASYAGEYGQGGITFYEAGVWQTTKHVATPGIWEGDWRNGGFFLGEEIIPNNSTGRVADWVYNLVAISVGGLHKYILWTPADVGLLERIKGEYNIEALAWYGQAEP